MNIGKSEMRQYLICHENEYKEGDITCLSPLPIKPNLPVKGTTNFVSTYAYETYDGDYVEQLRVEKKAVEVEAVCIGEDNLDRVNAAILDKIEQYGSRVFYINFYHPVRGWYFSKVYVGTPYETETPYVDIKDGSGTVTIIKFSLIEVNGTKLF